jgi:hypothetical protein
LALAELHDPVPVLLLLLTEHEVILDHFDEAHVL